VIRDGELGRGEASFGKDPIYLEVFSKVLIGCCMFACNGIDIIGADFI
jgi:hypothetical protein